MNFLNEDNAVHIILNKAGDLIVLNLLFIACCLPVVTIGPSLTALYHCTLLMAKGTQGSAGKTFLRAFKQNFIQSLAIWLGLLAFFFLLLMNLGFLAQAGQPGRILFLLSEGLAGLAVLTSLYLFPVTAAFSNTIPNLLKNSLLLAFMHFPSTLAIAAVTLLPMYMTYRDLKLMPLYACCWFFFGFSLTAYFNSLLLYRIFRPLLEAGESCAN